MFITPLKTLLVHAMKQTVDSDYIEADFRNLKVSIEYPVDRQDYPGIWVDFAPMKPLRRAGIDHVEFVTSENGNHRGHTRWLFDGQASYTVVAMSSLERDRLFDEVVRIMAFGKESELTSRFRSYIEDNEFIACNFDFDHIAVQQIAATAGTPWDTDEMIYEATVQMGCFGEFVADHATNTLAPLSAVELHPYRTDEPDPIPTGDWM